MDALAVGLKNFVIGPVDVLVTPLTAVEVVQLPRPLFPELYFVDSGFEGERDVSLVLGLTLDSFCVVYDVLCLEVRCRSETCSTFRCLEQQLGGSEVCSTLVHFEQPDAS